MQQDAQEHEDHVDDVQVQIEALGRKVIHDVGEAKHQSDEPQDLVVLDPLGGRVDRVSTLLVLHQQGGVHGNGMGRVGMHRVVDQRHDQQDHGYHEQVHRVEDRGAGRRPIHDPQDLGTGLGAHLQRDGAGQARMPDHEAGVGGGDEQRIVHVTDAAGHLLGQQGARDEAEAPVEPAADGGDEGCDQDRALLVFGQAGNGAQRPFADLGGSHGGTQHQHQRHLHGERQQAPEPLGVAPGVDQRHRPLLRADHGGDEHHDRQDNGEQERVRQPPVDYAHTAIGKFFEHNTPPCLSHVWMKKATVLLYPLLKYCQYILNIL